MQLLIVPYGIEIASEKLLTEDFKLLIVPYGIEIKNIDTDDYRSCTLLIVPYGIEISTKSLLIELHFSLNRTLWN